jgi:hypothetical protein
MYHLYSNTNLIEIRQVYWDSNDFDTVITQAINSTQPFVLVENCVSRKFLFITVISNFD